MNIVNTFKFNFTRNDKEEIILYEYLNKHYCQ